MYAEVSVIVNGAQEDFIPFYDETLMPWNMGDDQ